MRNSKGYTLTELLLAMAIFAIVMVGIVTVMRSVSLSYRNENTEVTLQENAQILLSQMEELLVDCKEISKSGDTYTIKDSNNEMHYIKYEDNTVKYKYSASSYEDLSDNVTIFDITGLEDADGDNVCVVKVGVENSVDGTDTGKTYTYETSKDVVFRNDVEKAAIHDSSFLTGSGGGTTQPPSPNTVTVSMGRYELLNLISDYDFDTTKPITLTGDTTAYNFVKEDGLNASNYMETVSKITSGAGTSGYLTTSDTCNLATSTAYGCVVKGTTKAGKDITLNISTPPVKLLKGVGVVYGPMGAINNGENKNYYSYISIEGLNVRDAKQYFNVNCTGALKFSSSLSASEMSGSIFSASDSWSDSLKYGSISAPEGMSSNTGLAYDPFSSDTLCVMFSSKLYESPLDGNQWYTPPASEIAARQAKLDSFNNANYEVKVTVTYPDGEATASSSETYKVYLSGAKLTGL